MAGSWRSAVNHGLAIVLCAFAASEINYPRLSPQSQLAIFTLLGLVLCFLNRPVHFRVKDSAVWRALDLLPLALSVACCSYVVVQTEPLFQGFWIGGETLGNRAGHEASLDIAVGVVGLILVLEATRRTIGLALPILAMVFLAYAFVGPYLPGWMFPHRGYGVDRVVAQTFLHGQGVFGTALSVMFTYVFLFVVFGAFLKQTGATQFIIDFAQRIFGSTPGAPAKVAVLSSGLMGSLSGSAVANTATTGTFTIPMMRSSGFKPEVAGGIEAASSSGGALVPPVMGAGAYMMLEIIDPPVTYLEVIRGAAIPAILYYLALLLIVHFYSGRIGAKALPQGSTSRAGNQYEGVVFVSAVAGLIGLLVIGYTVFRAVSASIVVVLLVSAVNRRTRITLKRALQAFDQSARDVIPLISAAACVGIIIGVVTLTGVGTRLPSAIMDLSQGNLLWALILIMISSITLGMGLPSAVCYLLMATLVGPVLNELGVVPLSAHMFIFYFGMMSMVTPPVALAAYTAATIAEAGIMATGFAAFRFALVGFTLPFMFVFRPELLMLSPDGTTAPILDILAATVVAALGILPFAAGIAGHLFARLSPTARAILFVSAALLLVPHTGPSFAGFYFGDVVGTLLLAGVGIVNWRSRKILGP